MGQGREIAVGASGDPGEVFTALSSAYGVHAEPPQTLHWTWLDTADWRLHRAGLALREERQGRARTIVLDVPGEAPLTAALSGVSWPARLDALASSPLRSRLVGEVGVRALLPVAEVQARRIPLRLMDGLDKTRVRVSVEQQRLLHPRRAALPLHIVVRPLRGYDEDAQRCVELLAATMSAVGTTLSPTDAALAAAGTLPDDSEPAHVAQPNDPALWPLARALLGHVAQVDDARDGAIADLDPEFLHELRVAIRATRALIAAAGDLLTGRAAVRVERDLSWLDEQTAPLRAVDITTIALAGESPLDVTGCGDLEPLRAALQKRRRTELRRMRQVLRGERAPAAFTAWRKDLAAMAVADTIGPTVAQAAPERARTAFEALAASAPEDLLARLDALREVLRAFSSGYGDGGERLLGDLDDLHATVRARDGLRSVQATLRAVAGPALDVAALLCAGALLDRAARLEAELDSEIALRYAKISGRKAARRIAALA